jgi:hypothetical protein
MKVYELIEKLKLLDQSLDVCFECADADYRHYYVEAVEVVEGVKEYTQKKEKYIILKD